LITLKNKTIQIRFSEEDYHKIKFAFKGENLSAIIRDFLLSQANEKLNNCDDMSLQQDMELQRFMSFLGRPEVQKTLFSIFRKARV